MKKALVLISFMFAGNALFAQLKLDKILYGAAYYYEYNPTERLDKDVQMMQDCGINVVRIAESTWALWEPQDGQFDFSKLDRVLNAMNKAGIKVIVGTPTYAVPNWLAKEHPEVLATTTNGQNKYGARQNMDIVDTTFRFYAERIISKLVEHVKDNPAVIGFQADNETKSYGNVGPTINTEFVDYLKAKFVTVDKLNAAFGLNYWSNTVNNWADFPPVAGNINASVGAEFSKFQRKVVTDYLAWQVAIIKKYKRPDQFVTQNFDLDWRGYSFGVQQDVDLFAAAKAFDVAGIDIYHPTADRLTGREIAYGGDITRSMKQNNYLVMETQAQSMAGNQELPYPGQLRLQAYSHLASGADMVEYWHWSSIHNSVETYWKGILSHDYEPNPTYYEVKKTAAEFNKIGSHLINLKKTNKVALLISNESLTAINWFPISDRINYNDVLRDMYDALYNDNVECDMVSPESTNIEQYSLLIVPPLYNASDSLLQHLNSYVKNGGHIVYAFKSGFSNEYNQVRSTRMPGLLRDACGFSYQQFTNIDKLPLKDDPYKLGAADNYVSDWAELLTPETCKVLAWYDHSYWGKYAAITKNNYGKGSVLYFGALPSKAMMQKLLLDEVKDAGLSNDDQQLSFPIIVKSGVNQYHKAVHYYFNYSGEAKEIAYPHNTATNLINGNKVEKDGKILLEPWGLAVLEETK
ncbi:beta-galactosidase [uncultured Mucilaginibacter sp.]|uniref:beta-galactosidase n=1 Tax=uncultured Mucilaginibacter sp. TaxID=797541 RepID=UPI0025E5855E|nr:beta-galactosidase [uncultured Mucilaginibacter sp.]